MEFFDAVSHSRGGDSPEFCNLSRRSSKSEGGIVSLLKDRGRRECRALDRTRNPRGLKRKNAHKTSGRAEIARHSLRNGFTAYSALSPEYRAC